MKKIIIYILICSMSFSYGAVNYDKRATEITALELDGEFTEIKASTDANSAYKNGKYKNVSDENLSKLGSFGVVKKESEEMDLSTPISKLDVLKYLVKLNGNDDAVLNRMKPQIQNKKNNLVKAIEDDEYIKEAITIGILKKEEAMNLNDDIDYMTMAKYLFHMLALKEKTEYSYKNYNDVNKSNRGIYEALLTEKIMTVDKEGNFKETKELSKKEVFHILNKVFERVYDKLGIVKNDGIVLGKKTDEEDKTGYTIKKEEILIRHIDGSLYKVLKETDPKKGVRDFVIFKNGVLNKSNALSAGDQVSYYTKNGDVLYAEVLKDGSILNQIALLHSKDNTFLYFGTIMDKTVETNYVNNEKYKINRVRATVNNFSLFDIIVKEDVKTGIKNDIIVYKNNKVGGIDLLRKGDRVEILLKDGKNVVYVKVKSLQNKYLKGTIKEVGERSITVLDYSNHVITYPALEYANITINKERNYLYQLQPGMEAKIKITNGYITAIDVETFLNPGYINPNSKIVTGTISIVGRSVIKMKNDHKTYNSVIIDDAKLIKNGQLITPSALKEGDKIKVYYSDINTRNASLIEVEGKENLVTDIYKGVIQNVDNYSDEITISRPSIIKNFQWKSSDDYSKDFSIDKESMIYLDGKKISLHDLSKNYIGKSVYIVAKDDYSKSYAVNLIIKSGSERFRVDTVRAVDNVVKKMKLDDSNQRLSYNEGTVFIKDSRIVEENSLSKNDDILVVSDSTPLGESASIVHIVPKKKEFFNNIYIGAIEDIYTSMFTLKNYAYVRDNKFTTTFDKTSSYFFYPSDITIKDLTDKKVYQEISAYDFYHGGYSRAENKKKAGSGLKYHRYYTFFVTDGNENIIGMNIRKKGLLYLQDIDGKIYDEKYIKTELDKVLKTIMFTKGTLKSIDATEQRIKLEDAYNWVEKYKSWNASRVDIDLEYKDAIFIKDNKRIKIEDISVSDQLYIVRDDEDALVVYVE